jgi:hypothetical protein
MKYLLIITSIGWLSLGFSQDVKERCMNKNDFSIGSSSYNKCVDIFCNCAVPCEEKNKDLINDKECFLSNGCSEDEFKFLIMDCYHCIDERPECNITAAPSLVPSSSPVPTVSTLPSVTPTVSVPPSVSFAPTTECTCVDCYHTASCNPGKA